MNILIAYFSATGNTRKIAKVIGETISRLGCHVAMSDITAFGSRQKKTRFNPLSSRGVWSADSFLARAEGCEGVDADTRRPG